jgi:hypothetical protein
LPVGDRLQVAAHDRGAADLVDGRDDRVVLHAVGVERRRCLVVQAEAVVVHVDAEAGIAEARVGL